MKTIRYFTVIILISAIYSCSLDHSVDLGNGYRFDHDPVISNDKAIFGPFENTYAVPGHIVAYNFDSIFIVAEQKPREVILKDTYNDPEMTYRKQENLFKESSLLQFWIIIKSNNSILGPYTKEEYLQKREELGVPKKLKLRE